MDTTDCYSALSDIKDDFEQLSSFVRDVQNFMVSQLSESQAERVALLEIQPKFLEPLRNIARLNQSLFEVTKFRSNTDQIKVLTIWEYMIAIFYCSIQRFIQLGTNSLTKENGVEEQKGNPIYQFYYHTAYDLWTPFNSLKGYAWMLKIVPFKGLTYTDKEKEFSRPVLTTPLIPEHEDTLKEIGYWIEQLQEFMLTAKEQTKKDQ